MKLATMVPRSDGFAGLACKFLFATGDPGVPRRYLAAVEWGGLAELRRAVAGPAPHARVRVRECSPVPRA